MVINPAEMDALGAYKLATSLLVPRPIAWVGVEPRTEPTTSPFSYFVGVSLAALDRDLGGSRTEGRAQGYGSQYPRDRSVHGLDGQSSPRDPDGADSLPGA